MSELRTQMLTTPPSEFGITRSSDFPRVYGVLMDWPLREHTATVVSLCDGNASLYTTSTFGVIGGVGHEYVRAAASQFVRTAEKHYNDSIATKEYLYPGAGRVRFYLVSFDDVRMIEADVNALTGGKDKCADLWNDGQRVLMQLRLVSDKKP